MRRSIWVLVFCLLGSTQFMHAQVETTSGIRGNVTDPSGAVIAGVSVKAKNQDTGGVWETVTNDAGFYSFPSLRPGTYTVSTSHPGFKSALVQNQVAQVAQTAQVNITLELGETTETVSVSAQSAELLNTTTGEIAASIDKNLVSNVPLEGRNFFELVALAPHTASENLGGGQNTFGSHSMKRVNAMGSYESSGVYAAGGRDSDSNISVDGANTQNILYGMSNQVQSQATIQEVKIQTATMNAEFGSGANAVTVITKGGTNAFHGEAFAFHRNDNLDATPFFTNLIGGKLPEYKRNTFGGSFGGPIVQNKLHFFGNYEGSRLRQAIEGNAIVPTDAVRRGDFSEYRPPLPGGGFGPAPTIYNPFSFNPATGLRDPFPGNRIPTNLLDPGAQALLKYTALPNSIIDGIPQYRGVARTEIDKYQYTFRIDWQKSANTTIYGRFTYDEREAFRGGLLEPLQGESTPSSTKSAVINWTQVLSPRAVNTFSASYAQPRWGIGRPIEVPDVAQEMGLTNTSSLTGSPTVNQATYTLGTSGLFIWTPKQHTYQIKDDFSLNVGKHSLKFGVSGHEKRLLFIQQSSDKGLLNFDRVFSQACPGGNTTCETARAASGSDAGGLPFADFLLGTPFGASRELRALDYNGHQRYYGFYAQDAWQIRSGFTLNYGLRYETWSPLLMPSNNAVRFDRSIGDLVYVLQNPSDALNPATNFGRDAALNPNIPREGYDTAKKNFSPRLGLAYQLRPDTVLRASGGIFYTGNINVNQLSDIQQGVGPWKQLTNLLIGRTEQLPPLNTRNLFPPPTPGGVPVPDLANPQTVRAIGEGLYKIPTVYQWSFTLQHRVGDWSVEGSYLGSKSIRISTFVDINAAELPQGSLAGLPIQQRRPFPGWQAIQTWIPGGWGKYHGGNISVRNQTWRGLTVLGSYGFVKNITTSTIIGSDQGNVHWRYFDIWAGPAEISPVHRFVAAWSYQLPFGKGKTHNMTGVMDGVFGGWNVSGITEFSTGSPRTIQTGDNTGSALAVQLPNRLADCDVDAAAKDRFQWFNTSCFVNPAFGFFGNSTRGVMTDPGINNWNISLAKSLALTEGSRLEIRFETYNTFNHTQLGGASTNLTSATYGRITSTREPRQIQIALRYVF